MLRLHMATPAATTVFAAGPASASAFTVNPTNLVLTPFSRSKHLTVKNESDQTLRFQLSACTWAQSSGGAVALGPTEDIVCHPDVLTLAPQEERLIEVEAVAQFSLTQRSYRVFVEEVPRAGARRDRALQPLTKIGIPVFMQPMRASEDGKVEDIGLRNGVLTFSLGQTGNVQMLPQQVTVKGFNRVGVQVFEHHVNKWYVMPDHKRDFEIRIPTVACRTITNLSVIVQMGASAIEGRLDTAQTA